MLGELRQEQDVINSIYGDRTFEASTADPDHYLLAVPNRHTIFRLSFPINYPDEPPQILTTVTVGSSTQKGHINHTITQAREVLNRIFTPGSVCVFDLLQELDIVANTTPSISPPPNSWVDEIALSDNIKVQPSVGLVDPSPAWTISSSVTVKKSLFIARVCQISTPSQAKAAVSQLLADDKRVAKATHSITAYRIRPLTAPGADNNHREIIYQDSNDDGETAAGRRLLNLLQVMDVWNVCVIVSRWYGGIQLGPDRFKLISQVAREAIVEGGWLKGGGRRS